MSNRVFAPGFLLSTTIRESPFDPQIIHIRFQFTIQNLQTSPIDTDFTDNTDLTDKTDLYMICRNAIFAYEQRALKPLLDELPAAEKTYLLNMSEVLNADRLAGTSDISRRLGVAQNKTSRARSYLINHGIIASPERGKLMFCVPYLADFVKKDNYVSDAVTIARQRRV